MRSHAITLARRVLREYHDIPTYEQTFDSLTEDQGDRDIEALSRAVLRDRGDAVKDERTAVQNLNDLLAAFADDLTSGETAAVTAKEQAAMVVEGIVAGVVEHSRELGYALGVAVGAGWRHYHSVPVGVPHV